MNKDRFKLPDVVRLPAPSNFLGGFSPNCVELEQYFSEKEGNSFLLFLPGAQSIGPPGFCHGGFISTILDESMGSCCWLNGHLVLTARMDVHYRARMPIHKEYLSSARITSVKGRRLFSEAEITCSEGKVYAQGEGTFVTISPDKLKNLPEYAGDIEKARRFMELRQQNLPLKEIFSTLGRPLSN